MREIAHAHTCKFHSDTRIKCSRRTATRTHQHAFHEMDAMPMNWPYAVLDMQLSFRMWKLSRSFVFPDTHAVAPTMYLKECVGAERRVRREGGEVSVKSLIRSHGSCTACRDAGAYAL